MATAFGNPTIHNTRRAPRYRASLPVMISRCDGSGVAVPGLTSEISQTGMAVFGGVTLETGDLMEVEFQTEGRFRVEGIVRNRTGYCFGLEFLNVLPSLPDEPPAPPKIEETAPQPASRPTLEGVVRLAEEEMQKFSRAWITAHRGDIAVVFASVVFAIVLLASGRPASDAGQTVDPPSLTPFERLLIKLDLAVPPPPAQARAAGNPNAQVWVDVHTALYYCSGSELYGKTAGGRFATQREARLDQFEPAAGTVCQ